MPSNNSPHKTLPSTQPSPCFEVVDLSEDEESLSEGELEMTITPLSPSNRLNSSSDRDLEDDDDICEIAFVENQGSRQVSLTNQNQHEELAPNTESNDKYEKNKYVDHDGSLLTRKIVENVQMEMERLQISQKHFAMIMQCNQSTVSTNFAKPKAFHQLKAQGRELFSKIYDWLMCSDQEKMIGIFKGKRDHSHLTVDELKDFASTFRADSTTGTSASQNLEITRKRGSRDSSSITIIEKDYPPAKK